MKIDRPKNTSSAVSMHHSGITLPPLENLRAFEAAARLGSFSAAGDQLGVTHGAVSRRIAGLEQWLGQTLFRRGGRGVTLTPDGDRLFARTIQAFELLSEGSDRWQDVRRGSVVRLTSLRAVCSQWIIPRLRDLETDGQRIRIDLVVDDSRPLDMEEFAIDLAIRVGPNPIAGRTSLKLLEEDCFPVANAELATRIGDGGVDSLLDFPLLNNRDATLWKAWLRSFGVAYRPRPEDRRFSDYGLVLRAAEEGLGIAIGRPLLITEAIKRGRLIRLGDFRAPNPHPYWLDRPAGPVRLAASLVARRIASAFPVNAGAIDAFLAPD
jgi:DNA-binding transcriptional LysR family regulator